MFYENNLYILILINNFNFFYDLLVLIFIYVSLFVCLYINGVYILLLLGFVSTQLEEMQKMLHNYVQTQNANA